MAEGHMIVGPDGKPIDPALAARLSKNPNLMLGRVSRPGGGERPRMEIDVAISTESVKKAEETIKGLQDEASNLRKLLDDLITKANEAKVTLEAMRDAVHA